MDKIEFRNAEKGDSEKILFFIKQLADYEHLSSEVVATKEILDEWIFDKKYAQVVFPVVDGKEIGFALYFHNFSTFQGRAGIYLEDLYILPEYRGHGYGKSLLRELARITVEEGCGRLEWSCLDWNRPSIGFYLSLGAEAMDEWTKYRLSGKTLEDMAK